MKFYAALFIVIGCAFAPWVMMFAVANPPVCNPPCKATERCVQLNSNPPGPLLPPVCIPK